jgi:hypothetical protein
MQVLASTRCAWKLALFVFSSRSAQYFLFVECRSPSYISWVRRLRDAFATPPAVSGETAGKAIRSSRVHASSPPRLVADRGTLRNGRRASPSTGWRTPHGSGSTSARHACARSVMAMSACGARLAGARLKLLNQPKEATPMFRGFSIFIPRQAYSHRDTRHGARGRGWRLMAPGLGLIGAALAIVIWPDLLAYFVASLLLCGGTVLLMVGWYVRQLEQSARRPMSSVPPLDLSHRDN